MITPADQRRVDEYTRKRIAELKLQIRTRAKKYQTQNRLKALPRVKTVYVNANYVNPVTLNKIPSGIVVYAVKDPKTGRMDYFDKTTFWRLLRQHAPNIKNNYNLMMAFPRRALFPNPLTRTGVTTRNIQRVVARPKRKTPSPSAAARKIQSAVREHLSKKLRSK